ncbi:MAG: hypothetical protein LBK45_05655 [Tannerellaceae bacterium]|jgi:hypothetical protein|nr:hypothetical protein [Tannerellaceae bacterium]
MKRVVFLISWALLLFSCSDDEKPSNNFIEGTRWQAAKSGSSYTGTNELSYNYQESRRMDFTNTTFTLTKEVKYDRNLKGVYIKEDSSTIKGTYTFEYPVTTLKPDDGKAIKIKIGTYQIETVPEGSEGSLIFTRVKE